MQLTNIAFRYYFLLLVILKSPRTQGFIVDIPSRYHHGLLATHQLFEMDSPLSRRDALRAALISFSSSCCFSLFTEPAHADLIQFPISYQLKNTYHFMRAGESLLESQDIISTNPLFLTNREDALSPNGVEQVQKACRYLLSQDVNPSLVKFSLAAKCIDTANIVATEMQVGRDKLIPEYTFMDPRGIGKWDRRHISVVENAVFAMDEMEAGNLGQSGRPPKNDDGTADETLGDQVVRLRELMSLCEGHCSGDTILLIFGDGTGPALLTALITGFPLHRVHELQFNPGEVRLNIHKDSLVSFPTEKSKEYLLKIREGQTNLENLINEETILAKQEAQDILERKEFKEKRFERALQMREKANTDRKDLDLLHEKYSVSDTLSPMSVGLVATVVSAVVSSKASTVDIENTIDDNDIEKLIANEGVSVLESVDNENEKNQSAPELQRLEDLVSQAPFTIPEIANKEKEERARVAQDAMNEYMNRDDGSEAFIGLIAHLLDDDDIGRDVIQNN